MLAICIPLAVFFWAIARLCSSRPTYALVSVQKVRHGWLKFFTLPDRLFGLLASLFCSQLWPIDRVHRVFRSGSPPQFSTCAVPKRAGDGVHFEQLLRDAPCQEARNAEGALRLATVKTCNIPYQIIGFAGRKRR